MKLSDVVEELKCDMLDPEGKLWSDKIYTLAARDALLEVLEAEDSNKYTDSYSRIIKVRLDNGACYLDLSDYADCNVQAINGLVCNVNGNTDLPEADSEIDDKEKSIHELDDLMAKYSKCVSSSAAQASTTADGDNEAYALTSWSHAPGVKTAIRFEPEVPASGDYYIDLTVYCPPDRDDPEVFNLENAACLDVPNSLLHLVRMRAKAHMYNHDTNDEYTDTRQVREYQGFSAATGRRNLDQYLEDLRAGRYARGVISPPQRPEGNSE